LIFVTVGHFLGW